MVGKNRGAARLGDSILEMDDDIRILRGMLKTLSMISECHGVIHPEALHVVAQFGEEAIDRLRGKWQAAQALI